MIGGFMGAVDSSIVTVSSKGWVVIPSLLRRKIGLKPGMKVSVAEVDGKIVLTPQIGDPVDTLFGKLAGGESLTEALLNARAEDRGRENKKFRSR
jgi:AbrB family looped-hinge helix DNA binding protein